MQLDPTEIRKILVVRLRSIGDTVLSTPTLIALRKSFPNARIDVLLEDWVAPVLSDFDAINSVVSVKNSLKDKILKAFLIRRRKYDLAINLHGGSTSTLLTRATGAKIRVGYQEHRYSTLYTHPVHSSAEFWGRVPTHSAEQQMALAGSIGAEVSSEIKSRLTLNKRAEESILDKLGITLNNKPLALIHPVAAFETKQWYAGGFSAVVDFLWESGFQVILVGTPNEASVLKKVKVASHSELTILTGLTLPEITALAAHSKVFIGNDSGIAHIAAAVGTPSVVIFGSSNRNHWYPWTNAPYSIVYEKYDCQPCAGYVCTEFDEPKCIYSVKPRDVLVAVRKVLSGVAQ
ncbi:MAG: glycosyltransferase family 9 protein [Pyrinomonadaceae bacterium]